MSRQKSSFVALVDSQNQILTIQRSMIVKHPGLWGLPGGRAEPGEDILSAGQREVFEEIMVKVDPWKHGHLTVRGGARTHVTFLPWTPNKEEAEHVNRLINGQMVSTEVMAVRWRTWAEINGMLRLHRSLQLITEKWTPPMFELLITSSGWD